MSTLPYALNPTGGRTFSRNKAQEAMDIFMRSRQPSTLPGAQQPQQQTTLPPPQPPGGRFISENPPNIGGELAAAMTHAPDRAPGLAMLYGGMQPEPEKPTGVNLAEILSGRGVPTKSAGQFQDVPMNIAPGLLNALPGQESMSPYQQEQIKIEREKMSQPAQMTPYQQETLRLRQEELGRQKQMTPAEARMIMGQVRSIAQSIKSDVFGEDPRSDKPIEQIMDSVAQEIGTTMQELSTTMLSRGKAATEASPQPQGAASPAERVPMTETQRGILSGAKKAVKMKPGETVVVEKDGKKFWLPSNQLQEAIRQGYRQVQ